MDEIRLCQDLVDELELEYVNEDRTTIIAASPEKIFQNTTIALWGARTYLGTKEINLGLPSLKTWLDNLALCGSGRSEMCEGVTYKFVKREFLLLFSEEQWLMLFTGCPRAKPLTPGRICNKGQKLTMGLRFPLYRATSSRFALKRSVRTKPRCIG